MPHIRYVVPGSVPGVGTTRKEKTMLVAKGKFDFTAEDLERAEKHIREATKEAMGSEEKMSTMLKTTRR